MEFLIALLMGLLAYLVAYNLLYRSQLRLSESEKRVNATTGIPRRSNPYMGKLATHLPSAAQAEASILAARTAPWPPRPWNLISVAATIAPPAEPPLRLPAFY